MQCLEKIEETISWPHKNSEIPQLVFCKYFGRVKPAVNIFGHKLCLTFSLHAVLGENLKDLFSCKYWEH